jgi:hypothetical protein
MERICKPESLGPLEHALVKAVHCTCLSESSQAADCQWTCSMPSEKRKDQSVVWTARNYSVELSQLLHMLLLWCPGM